MEGSEEQIREVQKAVRGMDHEAGGMEERSSELDSDIGSVRQEFRRLRNDESVPGLPPEPAEAQEKAGDEADHISPAAEQPPCDDD